MALRLIHDHLLKLDVSRYCGVLTKAVVGVYKRIGQLSQVGLVFFFVSFLNLAIKSRMYFFSEAYVYSPLCSAVRSAEERGSHLAKPSTWLFPESCSWHQRRHWQHWHKQQWGLSDPQRQDYEGKTHIDAFSRAYLKKKKEINKAGLVILLKIYNNVNYLQPDNHLHSFPSQTLTTEGVCWSKACLGLGPRSNLVLMSFLSDRGRCRGLYYKNTGINHHGNLSWTANLLRSGLCSG